MSGFVCYTNYVIERLSTASRYRRRVRKIATPCCRNAQQIYAGLAQLLERFLAMEEARS
jgi:hypothetical protein